MSNDNGNAVATIDPGSIMEAVIAKGDLSKLTDEQRATYYVRTCESMGMNPMTKPFEYIALSNKLTLYATRTATDQLRKINSVSLQVVSEETTSDGLRVVRVRASTPDGRADEEIGAVNVAGLKADALANAYMKAITKAKRRATLSICGLGWLDESEIETIPAARRVSVAPYIPGNEPAIDIAGPISVDGEVIDSETGEITTNDGVSPVDELLARVYAATTLDHLDAIRAEKNANGINDQTLSDAWRRRFLELGGKKAGEQPLLEMPRRVLVEAAGV